MTGKNFEPEIANLCNFDLAFTVNVTTANQLDKS